MCTVYKYSSNLSRHRLVIKGFRSGQDMHKFLNNQSDNSWREVKSPSIASLLPGTYVFVGGIWQNVKHINKSLLAHI